MVDARVCHAAPSSAAVIVTRKAPATYATRTARWYHVFCAQASVVDATVAPRGDSWT